MPLSRWKLLILLFFFRLLNSFSLKTFFQPDEFFQSLEPAHKLVYGYGYITWEWKEGLRSAIHPLLYACSYKVRDILNEIFFPSSQSIPHTAAPKVLNALIAALADYYTLRFSNAYWRDSSMTPLVLSVCSSWNWYTLTRSFSNNMEMLLTVAGLSYWPWYSLKFRSYTIACLCGIFSCIIRPTNALIWGLLAAHLLFRHQRSALQMIRITALALGLLVVSLSFAALADRFYYGKWTFPIYNFLEFNVVKNLSIFYGSNPWHFYLFQGIPLMLMGYIPAFILAIIKYRTTSVLVPLSISVIVAFSIIAHKEFRFLQPIYPILITLAAKYIDADMARRKLTKAWLCLTLILHASVAYFFSRINESGEISVIESLRNDVSVKSVGFLTPCHSTPWHSMLHRPELSQDSWFLTCEPPLHLTYGNVRNVKEYRDESDRFFDNPVEFISNLPYTWPSHLVVFEPMEDLVIEHLKEYHECQRFFNSYFHWDSRRSGDIIVYCRSKSGVIE